MLDILWLGGLGAILAVIFGHVALRQIQRGAQSGRGLAIAGLTLGYVGIAGIVLLVALGVVLSSAGSNARTKFETLASSIGSPTTTVNTDAAVAPAAGKPCVALSDPLPAGAPDVPLKFGAPPTDLVSEDLKVGDGAVVTEANTLSVHYIGVACSTGKIFDSSYSRGQPASFPLSNVI